MINIDQPTCKTMGDFDGKPPENFRTEPHSGVPTAWAAPEPGDACGTLMTNHGDFFQDLGVAFRHRQTMTNHDKPISRKIRETYVVEI